MKFSIIIPTYNEENDIADTLNALVLLDYPEKEIIVVDDSTDRTPDIVKNYADRGVSLIHPGGGGRCEARNIGIKLATGEVVCILNADVHLPKDFLKHIKVHYDQGADYVLVASKAKNVQDLFARYIDSIEQWKRYELANSDRIKWSEGFSCRRDIAIKAGLFPANFDIPICGGEDGFFGDKLMATDAHRVVDFSIFVQHVAPASFKEYWRIRKDRGRASPQCHYFLHKWSVAKIIIWNSLKTFISFFKWGTLIYPSIFCWGITRYSFRRKRDVFPFLYAGFIEYVAFYIGVWQSIFEIISVKRQWRLTEKSQQK